MNLNEKLWLIKDLKHGFYTIQIQGHIIEIIKSGLLKPFDVLPPYRVLAEHNHIYKNNVFRAYSKLIEMGWLKAKIGADTWVSHTFPGYEKLYPPAAPVRKMPIALHQLDLESINPISAKPSFVNVGFDVPCPQYFPGRIYYKSLATHTKLYGKLSQTQQVINLSANFFHHSILDYNSKRRNFGQDPDGMYVIHSRTESLRCVFHTLIKPGDVIVCTAPEDMELNLILHNSGAKLIYLSPLDLDFVPKVIALLEQVKIKAFYIRPQCSYPEGHTLTGETCALLLNLAKANRFYIVEEDDQHEFLYDHALFTPLTNYDHEGHVIYLGALSMLTPYTRNTRIILAAIELINSFKNWPLFLYTYRSIMDEFVIAELLDSGQWSECVKDVRAAKTKDRLILFGQLTNYIEDLATFQMPGCGLTYWLNFYTPELLKAYMALLPVMGRGVPYPPIGKIPDNDIKQMRLGFGSFDAAEVEEAGKKMRDKFSYNRY